MKKHAFIKIFLGLGLLATVGVILSEKAYIIVRFQLHY